MPQQRLVGGDGAGDVSARNPASRGLRERVEEQRARASEHRRAAEARSGLGQHRLGRRHAPQVVVPRALELRERRAVRSERVHVAIETSEPRGPAGLDEPAAERPGGGVRAPRGRREEAESHERSHRRRQPGFEHRPRPLVRRRVAVALPRGRDGGALDERRRRKPSRPRGHAKRAARKGSGDDVGELVLQHRVRKRRRLEVDLVAPRLRDVRVLCPHPRALLRRVREEEYGDRRGVRRPEEGLELRYAHVAIARGELPEPSVQRPIVRHDAAPSARGAAEAAVHRRGVVAMAERVTGGEHREPRERPREGQRPRSGAERPQREAPRRVQPTGEKRGEHRDPTERSDAVGHVRRGQRHVLVVDRARKEAEERIEGEHRRRRVEPREAPHDERRHRRGGDERRGTTPRQRRPERSTEERGEHRTRQCHQQHPRGALRRRTRRTDERVGEHDEQRQRDERNAEARGSEGERGPPHTLRRALQPHSGDGRHRAANEADDEARGVADVIGEVRGAAAEAHGDGEQRRRAPPPRAGDDARETGELSGQREGPRRRHRRAEESTAPPAGRAART